MELSANMTIMIPVNAADLETLRGMESEITDWIERTLTKDKASHPAWFNPEYRIEFENYEVEEV